MEIKKMNVTGGNQQFVGTDLSKVATEELIREIAKRNLAQCIPANLKKFLELSEEQKARAYDQIYAVALTEDEVQGRPTHIKANRVDSILKGEITPGCYALQWYSFFKILESFIAE